MYKMLVLTFALAFASLAGAEEIEIDVVTVTPEGTGLKIGTITAKAALTGIELIPDLIGLAPGEHGFHLHKEPNCGPAEQDGKPTPGLAAGGHFDPANTGAHAGPTGSGHLGDLPVLIADQDGNATQPMTAPRLKLSDLNGHALIIHAGGDNYSDIPEKLGGGGPRVACGVIP
jgi:superoxide dismutase, Cu-Zn family